MDKILKLLKEKQDNSYGDFIHKLTPTLSREYFLGVRVPDIRKIAGNLSEIDKQQFIDELPHKYYEENMLHGFILQKEKDYDKWAKEINEFLPYVDNWATNDTMTPKMLAKHKDKVLVEIKQWIKTSHTYKLRFSILLLMQLFLDEDFKEEYFDLVNNVKSNEYYVKIMVAWYYATALAKQYDSAIKVIESKKLDKWIHNKSIQKSIESSRISLEHKNYLKTLRIKSID